MGIYNCCKVSNTKQGIIFDQDVIKATPKNNKNLTFGISYDVFNENVSPEFNIDVVKQSNIKALIISDNICSELSKGCLLANQDIKSKHIESIIKIQRYYKKRLNTKNIDIRDENNIYKFKNTL